MDEVDENYSGIWMFEEIFNLGGNEEKQKLIEIDKTLKPDDANQYSIYFGTTGQPKGATLSH